jgi:2-polyprenyl-3-methyl-5-hydroxy-6-metoxy-1,4-benzoquinol methylase
MPLNWIDVTDLSFNVLLLLEREQLAWLPGWLPEPELATALKANPAVEWYLRHKNPALNPWVDKVMAQVVTSLTLSSLRSASHLPMEEGPGVRAAEETILRSINDLVVYAVNPQIYAELPFLGWDDAELIGLTNFRGKTVVDVGSGTGRLAFTAAEAGAHAIFAVEPVGNLRVYVKGESRKRKLNNVFTIDGLITDLPFPDDFVDIVMGGHVFGDHPEAEHAEMVRVAKPGGMIILCPGNNDQDNERHQFLVDQGFEWSQFEEPGDGIKRKYWKTVNMTGDG